MDDREIGIYLFFGLECGDCLDEVFVFIFYYLKEYRCFCIFVGIYSFYKKINK